MNTPRAARAAPRASVDATTYNRLKNKVRERKMMWDRVDTDLLSFPFTGENIDRERMHKALTLHRHACWKMMVEQLLEDDMGFTLEGQGNILRKGDKVYDAWKSVDRWFWVITHRFEPRIIEKNKTFGEEKNTYIVEGMAVVAWKGLKYRHDWHDHRDVLLGEALAHLVETDKADKEYLQSSDDEPAEPDELTTLMEIAKDLVAIANEDSKIVIAPPAVSVACEAILEEKKVEESEEKKVMVL
jgi:hypothetical protein